MSSLTASQVQTIQLATQILDPIAFFLVSVVLVTMISLRQWKTARYHYLIMLFVCFWMNLLVNLLLDFTYSTALCYFSGPWVQFFSSAIWLWDVAIAVCLFRLVVRLKLDRPSFWSHWMIWTFQALLTSLPATTSSYGPPECFIQRTTVGFIWWFWVRHMPLLIYLLLVTVLYCSVGYKMFNNRTSRGTRLSSIDSKVRRNMLVLFLFPIAFWITWLPNLVYQMYNWATDHRVYEAEIACTVLFCLHPIFSALIYLCPVIHTMVQRRRGVNLARIATTAHEMRSKISADGGVAVFSDD